MPFSKLPKSHFVTRQTKNGPRTHIRRPAKRRVLKPTSSKRKKK